MYFYLSIQSLQPMVHKTGITMRTKISCIIPCINYFYEGRQEAHFLGEKVLKYHKTMTTYLSTLIRNGFQITGVMESQPTEDADSICQKKIIYISADGFEVGTGGTGKFVSDIVEEMVDKELQFLGFKTAV